MFKKAARQDKNVDLLIWIFLNKQNRDLEAFKRMVEAAKSVRDAETSSLYKRLVE